MLEPLHYLFQLIWKLIERSRDGDVKKKKKKLRSIFSFRKVLPWSLCNSKYPKFPRNFWNLKWSTGKWIQIIRDRKGAASLYEHLFCQGKKKNLNFFFCSQKKKNFFYWFFFLKRVYENFLNFHLSKSRNSLEFGEVETAYQ